MKFGRVASSTAICLAMIAALAPPTLASGSVTITAEGPASFPAAAGRSTATYWATFTILDSTATATSLHACRILPTGSRECDTVPLVPQNFSDGNWAVIAVPGGWQYRWRLGYYEMTREECWRAAFSKQPYRIVASVRNPADVELSSATHAYRVDCSGLAGSATGPKYHKVYAGRPSGQATMTFFLLDTRHTIKSYRACAYNSISGKYTSCQRAHLTRKSPYYTAYGWAVTRSLSWNAVGSALCSYIGRKWPQAGMKVTFYDDYLNPKYTLFHGFRMECG